MNKWIRKHSGRSIVKFLIGLLILAIIAGVAIYMLTSFDYSHLLPADADTRPYTGTHAPAASPTPTALAQFPSVNATPKPTVPVATKAPVPTATVKPTPAPTPVPTLAEAIPASAHKLSRETRYGNIGISQLSFDGTVVTMEGWGYADVYGFDGRNSRIYLVVQNLKGGSDSYIVYETTKEKGITGVTNTSENAFNLDEAEFSVRFDVANVTTVNGEPMAFPDGKYAFGLSLFFDYEGSEKQVLYKFDTNYNLTVKDGKIEALLTPGTTPAPTEEPAEPVATAEADTTEADTTAE
ncbi:MAG: hypothetical protein E7335_03775 [Clostridiales bacterium]|nr:hypothetical protein [Clostridiales bacterium]